MDSFSCPIAVTGSSAVTVAGYGLQPVLEALREGRCCLQPVPDDLLKGAEGLLWGRADSFRAADFMPPLKARKLDRCSQFAVAAAGRALAEAGIVKDSIPGVADRHCPGVRFRRHCQFGRVSGRLFSAGGGRVVAGAVPQHRGQCAGQQCLD